MFQSVCPTRVKDYTITEFCSNLSVVCGPTRVKDYTISFQSVCPTRVKDYTIMFHSVCGMWWAHSIITRPQSQDQSSPQNHIKIIFPSE